MSLTMPLSQEARVHNFCYDLATPSFVIISIHLLQSEFHQVISNTFFPQFPWPNFSPLSLKLQFQDFPYLGISVLRDGMTISSEPDMYWNAHDLAKHIPSFSGNTNWDSINQFYSTHHHDNMPLHTTCCINSDLSGCWSRDTLNFEFLEKGLGLVPTSHFAYNFLRNILFSKIPLTKQIYLSDCL